MNSDHLQQLYTQYHDLLFCALDAFDILGIKTISQYRYFDILPYIEYDSNYSYGRLLKNLQW
jgi:hypothetical protein